MYDLSLAAENENIIFGGFISLCPAMAVNTGVDLLRRR